MLKQISNCVLALTLLAPTFASGEETIQRIYTRYRTELKVQSTVLTVIPPATFLPKLTVDVTGQWIWTEVVINGKPLRGWVLAKNCATVAHSVSGNRGGGFESEPSYPEKVETTNQPNVGRSDPHYNEERSPFTPEGERSLEREMRNEALYGVPYDPFNLGEQMVYCSLYERCE